MARGAIAKQIVTEKIKNSFGADFIGIQDNKIYVQADDGGGKKVQIAIAMTCPKVELAAEPAASNTEDWDFSDPEPKPQPQKFEPTEDEQANLTKLLERLGL